MRRCGSASPLAEPPGVRREYRAAHPHGGCRARQDLQEYFGKSWCNPHLYDLMISSRDDEDSTARAIVFAMTGQA